jgi:hypothetical protein
LKRRRPEFATKEKRRAGSDEQEHA